MDFLTCGYKISYSLSNENPGAFCELTYCWECQNSIFQRQFLQKKNPIIVSIKIILFKILDK